MGLTGGVGSGPTGQGRLALVWLNWVRLDWVGLGRVRLVRSGPMGQVGSNKLGWIGLGRVRSGQVSCYETTVEEDL